MLEASVSKHIMEWGAKISVDNLHRLNAYHREVK